MRGTLGVEFDESPVDRLVGRAVEVLRLEDLDTSTQNSSMSGARLFRAEARLTLPEGVTDAQVRAALERISGEIMVDFTVSSANPA